MAARFWVGGTGNWSDTAHWSTISGGGGGSAAPTSADDVTFDANSGTLATVTIDVPALALSITINKSDLTLLDNSGMTVAGTVTLTTGTLNTNGQAESWAAFSSNGAAARTLTMGASAISITGTGTTIWSTTNSITVTNSTATITANGSGITFSHSGTMNGVTLVLTGSAVTIASGPTLAAIDASAVTTSLTISASITLTGNLTLPTARLTTAGAGGFLFTGTGTPTVTFNGSTIGGGFQVGTGGANTLTVTIADTSRVNGTVTLFAGTLNTNGQTCAWNAFSSISGQARSMLIAGSTISLTNTGTATIWNFAAAANLTFVSTGALIDITDVGAGTKTFIGAGLHFPTLRYANAGSGGLIITGNNTFDVLDIESTVARTVTLPASGTTTIVNAVTFQGPLSVVSSTPGTATVVNAQCPAVTRVVQAALSADITINSCPQIVQPAAAVRFFS